jgi:hypothetical protein
MAEFKNNKEGKTEELRVRDVLLPSQITQVSVQEHISKQKIVLKKQTVDVKVVQKELQTATIERGTLRPLP